MDFNEIFSPVVKYTSNRILLSLVVQFDLFLVQMDVKTAYFCIQLLHVHGELNETIYTKNQLVVRLLVNMTMFAC